MKLPVDSDAFRDFIRESNIFGLTRKLMHAYLENWYREDRKAFVDSMWADFDTVMQTYHFFDEMVSFNKNFNFEPPMDTVYCLIRISDKQNSCCICYKAVFDHELTVIDDFLTH